MAKVLLLTLVFAPDGVSTAQLMTELAQELHGAGHEVTVLTTTPHYNVEPEARARQPLAPHWGRWLYRSELDGIRVYHASIPVKGDRVGARLLDYLRFHLISTLAGLFAVGRYDLLLVPSPPLTIGVSAWLLGLLRRVPFIYNVQEIYPDVAVSLGVLRNPLLIRLMEGLERWIYGRATVITVISEWFRRRLVAKGTPEARLTVIPNFVDTAFMQPQPPAARAGNAFAHAHELVDKFVVLYAGNIGLTQGFETILAAAQKLQHLPDLRFVIVGDGARRAWLAETVARTGAPNVCLLPYQPRSVVPQIYAAADLCLVPLKRGTAQETFPSKIYTIMAAGRAEWGPRALGNRSIVADPRRHDMKEILNARIKHREPCRPFAPSILQEDVGDSFDQRYPDPLLIKVYNVLPEKQNVIPAVTHVDGTGRLQTVEQHVNPRYWGLINAFKQETGVPVVLNTSFPENEPMARCAHKVSVCTPDEAVGCLLRTKMDALAFTSWAHRAIGNFLVEKEVGLAG